MKTVAELIEERRDDELEYVKAYIREKGGAGLYCPEEPCGCGLDNLTPCGECLDDLSCVPARLGKGEWEGEKDVDLYFPIEDKETQNDKQTS